MPEYKRVDKRNRTSGTGKNLHEHRVVMEKLLGRTLSSDEIVHHKDHDKRNNDPSNLELTSRSHHPTIHAKQKLLELGKKCAVTTCSTLTMAWHGLCHKHSTIQGAWASKQGHRTGWGLEIWLNKYRERGK